MDNSIFGLSQSTRGQALVLYKSLQGLSDDLSGEQQRALLSEALEEVAACMEEMETADEHLLRANVALEEARRQADERCRRYEDLFESAPCGYLVTNAAGIIREANRCVAELFGVRADYLRGKPLIVFLPASERSAFYGKLTDAARDGGAKQWKLRLQTRANEVVEADACIRVLQGATAGDAEMRWTLQAPFSAAPAAYEAGGGDGVEASLSRVEELEQHLAGHEAERLQLIEEKRGIEEKLRVSQRTIDGLVGRISDMENRLNRRSAQAREASRSQNSAARFVTRSCAEPLERLHQQAHEMLRELSSCLPDEERRRLTSMVRLLDGLQERVGGVTLLGRVDERPLNLETVDTALLAAEALGVLKKEQAGRNLEVRIGVLPTCRADRELLLMAFTQLLSNALKFTRGREVATIQVGFMKERRRRFWFVRDNGVGFRKDQEHRLFVPFQNLHRAQGFEGTGVGLAIVKQIAARHGGAVWAEGRENNGASFYFSLHDETVSDEAREG